MSRKKLLIDYIPSVLAAILIIIFAVIKEQTFIKTLPTLITLAVLLMSVNANRYAFLLGAGNSILYAIAYLDEGLYFSAASALLVSLPIQIFSFFHWTRHRSGKTRAVLKAMKPWHLTLTVISVFPLWALCYFGLSAFFTGSFAALDSLLFVLGILVSVLVALRFIEGQYINAVSCLISLAMWILICIDNPDNTNYVIIALYNLFRTVEASVSWTALYLRGKNDRKAI